MRIATIDFETLPIQARPDYPPEPVGVAIKLDAEPAEYFAWGHESGNNTDRDSAVEMLNRIWADEDTCILCHNAAFDLSVAYERLGLPELSWRRIHDTMYLLFLANPHAPDLKLKTSAETYLGMAPDEETALHDWLWDRRSMLPTTPVRPARTKMGAFIAYAPGDIVAPYAIGDAERTYGLFVKLMPLIEKYDMCVAYNRERRLLPILMENERRGIRVDLERLEEDCETYEAALNHADEWLRKRLNAPGLSLDNDSDYADALSSSGAVPEEAWSRTATGRRSVAKTSLRVSGYKDPEIAYVYGYRNRLATCYRMFLSTWRDQGRLTGGSIYPQWNQVRGERGGTRTGRPSMTNPNLLNVSKTFEGRDDGWRMPESIALPALPLVREYLLPDEGHTWLERDYSGQELRVYAHFERGAFWRQYRIDPRMDAHAYTQARIKEITGNTLERTLVKNINFGRIYGAGAPRIADFLGGDIKAARRLIEVHKQAMPDLSLMHKILEAMGRAREPIRTWGGRIYFAEPAKVIDGKMREFFYKLLNYLVQGSSADITKEAIIRWREHTGRDPAARLLLAVYDSIGVSAPSECALQQMTVLNEAMTSIELSVPLLSDGKMGPAWGLCKPCD